MQIKDDADRTFVSEVFAGCVRYQGLIKVHGKIHVQLQWCVYVANKSGLRVV